MSHVSRILYYRGLDFARWLRSHLYALGMLGPLILGGLFPIIEPYLRGIGLGIRSRVVAVPGCLSCIPDFTPVSLTLSLTAIGLSLPTCFRDLYPARSAHAYLEAWPISEPARFHTLLALRFAKNIPVVGLMLLFALPLSADRGAYLDAMAETAFGILFAVASLALLEILFVLLLVHLGFYSAVKFLLVTALLAGLGAGIANHPLFFVPFAPFMTPILQFNAALARIITGTSAGSPVFTSPWLHLPILCALYGMAILAYMRWHNEDREKALAATSRRGALSEGLLRRAARRWGPALSCQIARDLSLTWRGFSTSVYLAGSCCALFQLLFVFLARRFTWSTEEFDRIAGACCTLSAFSLAALGPLLLKYQLPYFWIEKASGLSPEKMWQAKLWYARFVALPALLVSSLAAASLHPGETMDRLLLVAKLSLIAFVVSSFVGYMTFEIARHPILGLLLTGIAVGTGTVLCLYYWYLWPLWVYVYANASHALGERARMKAWLTEAET